MDAYRKDFLARVEAAWKTRAATPDGRRLTRLHVHVAAKLAYWRSTTPRHRALARASRCCTRTVRRALDRLRALGLLNWQRRVVRGVGWRAQTSNAYTITPSCLPLFPTYQVLNSPAKLSTPARSTTAPAAATDAQAALAARREAMDARLLAGWRPGGGSTGRLAPRRR